MLNAIFQAEHVEHMRHVARCWPISITGWKGGLNAVVGQHRVDFVGHSFNERDEESRNGCSAGLSDQLDASKNLPLSADL